MQNQDARREDHPIAIERGSKRVIVKAAGHTLADTTDALILREASMAAVYYFPRDDVNFAWLSRSAHTSYCPYKGTASYYHLSLEQGQVDNAVWSYETPYPRVADIEGYVAFYPNRVEISEA